MIVRQSVVYVDPNADLQAAINALGSTGGIVQLGPGSYTLTSTLTLPDNVPIIFRGSGTGTSTGIEITGLEITGGTVLRMSNASPNSDILLIRGSGTVVEDMTLLGPSLNVGGTGRGIVIGSPTVNVTNVELNRVRVGYTCREALYVLGGSENGGRIVFKSTFKDCVFRQCGAAGATHGTFIYVGTGCTTITFDQCSITRWVGTGVLVDTADGISFINHCTVEEPFADNQSGIVFANCRYPKVHDCWFENSTAFTNFSPIVAQSGGYGLSIKDCNFESTNRVQSSITVSNTVGVSIDNCWEFIVMATLAAIVTPNHVYFGSGVANHSITGGGIVLVNTVPNTREIQEWTTLGSTPNANDLSGGLVFTNKGTSDAVSYEDDYVMYEDAIVTY